VIYVVSRSSNALGPEPHVAPEGYKFMM